MDEHARNVDISVTPKVSGWIVDLLASKLQDAEQRAALLTGFRIALGDLINAVEDSCIEQEGEGLNEAMSNAKRLMAMAV